MRIGDKAGIGLIVCALAGCAAAPRKEKLMTTVDGVSLAAVFTVDPARLEIRYSARNAGLHDVYLTDVAVLLAGSEIRVEPPQPRATFVEPDLAVFSDSIEPPPPGTLFASPPQYYTRLLKAGTGRDGVITLALPAAVAELRPKDETREVACRQLRFVLGMIPDSPELQAQEQTLAGVPVWRLGPSSPRLQRELAVQSEVAPAVRLLVKH